MHSQACGTGEALRQRLVLLHEVVGVHRLAMGLRSTVAKRERRHLGISGPIRPYVARIARRHRNYTYRSLTITALSQDSKYNGWPEAHVEGRIRMAFEKRVYGRSTADSPAAAPERPYPVAHSERKRITLGSREASRYAKENTCSRLGCWSVMVAS